MNRYSFTIEGCEQKHDCDYKISRNEDGHFTETRECREHVQILHCSIPLNTPLKGTHHTKTLRTKTVPSSTSVMDYFFAALTELLRHRGLFYVTLRDVHSCSLLCKTCRCMISVLLEDDVKSRWMQSHLQIKLYTAI